MRRDGALKIVKVFNNNSVSVILPGGREAILLGNGIGFHKRSGEAVDEQRVEKVYYVQTEMQTKFLEMLQDVQPDVMEAAERIIDFFGIECSVEFSEAWRREFDRVTPHAEITQQTETTAQAETESEGEENGTI